MAIGSFVAATVASAVPINLGITTGQPASIEDALARLNTQIALYNASSVQDLAFAALEGAEKTDVANGAKSFSLDVTGWDFLVLKFGPRNQHFYVGDDTGLLSFTTQFGLSNYIFFNSVTPPAIPVRDAGNTVMLTGLAFLALAAYGRIARRPTGGATPAA